MAERKFDRESIVPAICMRLEMLLAAREASA